MELINAIVITLITLMVFYQYSNKKIYNVHPLFTSALLLIKFLIAFFFLYVYTYIYGGGELTADAGRFFEESKILHEVHDQNKLMFWKLIFGFHIPEQYVYLIEGIPHWVADDSQLLNDSQNVLRVNALILFLSQGNIYIHFIIFSFISFIGAIDLFHWLKQKSTLPPYLLMALLTLTPSVAFWGASILKEPLLFLGFYLLIRGIFDSSLNKQKRIIRIIFGTIFMILFKPYIIIAFAISLIIYAIISLLKNQIQLKYLIPGILVIGLTFLISPLSQHFVKLTSKQQLDFIHVGQGGLYLSHNDSMMVHIYEGNTKHVEFKNGFASVKKDIYGEIKGKEQEITNNYILLTPKSKPRKVISNLKSAGSSISVTPINNSSITMLKLIPNNIYNIMLRPMPNDRGSWLKYLAMLENIFLLSLSILSIFHIKKNMNFKEKNISISLLFFIFILINIVGWTTPILGAIVRYKTPAIIAFMVILSLTVDYQKLKLNFLKIVKKKS